MKCYSQKDLNSFKSTDRPEKADQSEQLREEESVRKQLKRVVNMKPPTRKSTSANKIATQHLIIKSKDESAPILKGIYQAERRPIIRKFKSQNIKNDIIKNNLSSDQVSYRKVMDRSINEDEPIVMGGELPPAEREPFGKTRNTVHHIEMALNADNDPNYNFKRISFTKGGKRRNKEN